MFRRALCRPTRFATPSSKPDHNREEPCPCRGRYYLASPVTGMWDRQAAAALAQFFEDRVPGPLSRPSNPASATRTLGPRDSNLAKLANGQSLAVLKSTASVYDHRHNAPAGVLGGGKAVLEHFDYLTDNRRQKLLRLLPISPGTMASPSMLRSARLGAWA